MGFFGTNAALGKIDRDISAIAEGQADLSHPVGTGGNDVYGRISGNITRFFGRVRSLISHSREQSVSIAADAARMNQLVQQTDDAVRRQELLAANVFESSNRVNQAVAEVAMNADAISLVWFLKRRFSVLVLIGLMVLRRRLILVIWFLCSGI